MSWVNLAHPQEASPNFQVNIHNTKEFTITLDNGDRKIRKKESFFAPFTIGQYELILLLDQEKSKDRIATEKTYGFKYKPKVRVVNSLSRSIGVEPVGKQSNVLKLTYNGPNPKKNEAIINALIETFSEDGVRDKQLVSKRTEDFVTHRSRLLFQELDTVESSLVNLKRENNIVTVESTAQQLFTRESESAQKRYEIKNQLALASDFLKELHQTEPDHLLPSNFGLGSGTINGLTEKYNELALIYSNLTLSATQENPRVKQLKSKLKALNTNIVGSVSSYVKDLQSSLAEIDNRHQQTSGSLNIIPEMERSIRGVKRQQEVKENLYLFLLQKREEAALQYAVTTPNVKVVDYAYTQSIIAPDKKNIYRVALILGVLIPFAIIYIVILLDTKVKTRQDLEDEFPNVPILAELPTVKGGGFPVVAQNDRSYFGESFRVLRTNLSFLQAKGNADGGKIVYTTSSIKGEGKTFTAINLAKTLCLTGKSVLLIGTDLRNPQIHKYFGYDKNGPGVTSYLLDETVQIEDITYDFDLGGQKLNIISSGAVPPNPAELLLSSRYGDLLAEAQKRFDYIVVDTAPLLLVTDTLLIAKYADVMVYVLKSNHTDLRILGFIKSLIRENKIKNVGFVINGIRRKRMYGYNYGYGYHEEADTAKWWQFWRK